MAETKTEFWSACSLQWHTLGTRLWSHRSTLWPCQSSSILGGKIVLIHYLIYIAYLISYLLHKFKNAEKMKHISYNVNFFFNELGHWMNHGLWPAALAHVASFTQHF